MGGPQPLRSTEGPEVYGLKDLTAEDKQKAREGNILALRAHQTASHAHRSSKPWLLEQPHEREEKTSMFKLDEYRELIATDGVFRYTFCTMQIWSTVRQVDGFVEQHQWLDRVHSVVQSSVGEPLGTASGSMRLTLR